MLSLGCTVQTLGKPDVVSVCVPSVVHPIVGAKKTCCYGSGHGNK